MTKLITNSWERDKTADFKRDKTADFKTVQNRRFVKKIADFCQCVRLAVNKIIIT